MFPVSKVYFRYRKVYYVYRITYEGSVIVKTRNFINRPPYIVCANYCTTVFNTRIPYCGGTHLYTTHARARARWHINSHLCLCFLFYQIRSKDLGQETAVVHRSDPKRNARACVRDTSRGVEPISYDEYFEKNGCRRWENRWFRQQND